MKELSIEEKAKRYDEAIELVNSKWHYKGQPCVIDVSEIFPELKQDKDESIRKWFIEYFQGCKSEGIEEFDVGVKVDDIIDWLERQGKQKLVDKIKPKFNIGDWVVVNNNHQSIYQVEKIENGYYILRHTHGGRFRVCVIDDESLRLWTIKDARWGDVLVFNNDNIIVIFKDLYNDTTFHSYCHIEDKTFNISKNELPDWWESKGFYPATKEQRDLFFQNMKEKGYKWNDNTKEVIKL